MVVSLAVYAANSRTLGETNTKELEELKQNQIRINGKLADRVNDVEALLNKMDGKLDILLQNRK